MKRLEIRLRQVCENNYGFLDVTPGTDIASRLYGFTDYAIKTMIKRGWLNRVGTGLVLTKKGYQII